MASLQDFITSRVRVKILELFFQSPESMYYVREITRKCSEEINAVRRELAKMVKNGILRTEERGNRQYFQLNKNYAFYSELQQMVLKEQGLGKKIRRMHKKLGVVNFVMFAAPFINRYQKPDGVDVLVVGEVVVPELEQLIKEEERNLGREINYTVLDMAEFKFRKQRRDPFISDALYGKKVMIIGSEEELVDRKIAAT
ncbi:MAG: winged helix-turn-helix domain-containing protein [Pseudomonadales bacterium]|jgi:DNA-binding transcriptional ArsR family regulator|nr:winged helix-turn-helix domain-containing protein [Pseudomonadales bacterium]